MKTRAASSDLIFDRQQMKNAIYVPAVAASEWIREILPNLGQAQLPIAGKRLVDFSIEQAQRGGVNIAEVLDWHWSEAIHKDFADLTHCAIPVFYAKGEGPVPRGLDDLEKVSSPLTQSIDDGLYVVWGMYLWHGDLADGQKLELLTPEECADTPQGVYKRIDGKWMRIIHDAIDIRDVKSWHAANLTILHEPGDFTLPGYSAERDVHLGRNVVLEHGVDAKPPVLMQDGSWCARNVELAGDVIVGNGSFIGEGARLRRTVVGDDTYIGLGLELVDKIVIGQRIIDVQTGAWMDVEEPGLARRIGGAWGWLRKLLDFLHGKSKGRK